jgi:lipopolysaccharide transport system permease protein
LGELWRYRELLFFLALRDIKLRYKQTFLGIAWAVIQPVFTMLVFTLFLGNLGHLGKDTDPIPYSILVFCALLPWQLFANSLNQAGNSLVSNERLITKVYFPRLLMPMSSVLAGLLDFAIQLAILLGMMFCRHKPIVPGWGVLALPAFVLLAVLAAMSVGLWLSALNVLYRDVRYAIPFLTQFWMIASPVVYPMSLVEKLPRWAQVIYSLNPMVGVVEGFHWALLRDAHRPGLPMAVSAAATIVLLIGGMYYFRRMEKTFADVV